MIGIWKTPSDRKLQDLQAMGYELWMFEVTIGNNHPTDSIGISPWPWGNRWPSENIGYGSPSWLTCSARLRCNINSICYFVQYLVQGLTFGLFLVFTALGTQTLLSLVAVKPCFGRMSLLRRALQGSCRTDMRRCEQQRNPAVDYFEFSAVAQLICQPWKQSAENQLLVSCSACCSKYFLASANFWAHAGHTLGPTAMWTRQCPFRSHCIWTAGKHLRQTIFPEQTYCGLWGSLDAQRKERLDLTNRVGPMFCARMYLHTQRSDHCVPRVVEIQTWSLSVYVCWWICFNQVVTHYTCSRMTVKNGQLPSFTCQNIVNRQWTVNGDPTSFTHHPQLLPQLW